MRIPIHEESYNAEHQTAGLALNRWSAENWKKPWKRKNAKVSIRTPSHEQSYSTENRHAGLSSNRWSTEHWATPWKRQKTNVSIRIPFFEQSYAMRQCGPSPAPSCARRKSSDTRGPCRRARFWTTKVALAAGKRSTRQCKMRGQRGAVDEPRH